MHGNREALPPVKQARREFHYIGLGMVLLIVLDLVLVLCAYGIVWAADHKPPVSVGGFSRIGPVITALGRNARRHELWYALIYLISMVGANVLPFLYCARKTEVRVRELFARPRTGPSTTALFFVVAVGANLLISWLLAVIGKLLSLIGWKLTTPDFSLPRHSPAAAAVMIVVLIVAAPVTEEFIFRGVVLRVLRRYGSGFAVVGSSLLWALLHGNLIQSLPVFAVGIFLGILAIKADSIRPTIAVHMANNLYSVLMSLCQSGTLPVKAAAVLTALMLATAAVTLFCVFYPSFSIKRSARLFSPWPAFITAWTILVVLLYNLYRIVTSVRPV